jgi:hypothetical protein
VVWGYQCYYNGGLLVSTTRGSWSIYVVVYITRVNRVWNPQKERVDGPLNVTTDIDDP